MTEGDLYDYGNTQLGQQIAIINGVSQVQVYGARSAIRIKVQVNQLSSLGLTMTDVTNAVGQSTAYLGAGQLDGKNRTYLAFSRRPVVESSAVRKCHHCPAKRTAGLFEGRGDGLENRGGRTDQQEFLGA